VKHADLLATLVAERWSIESDETYRDATTGDRARTDRWRLSLRNYGHGHGRTRFDQDAARVVVWQAHPEIEDTACSVHRHRIAFVYDTAGRVTRTLSWANGTTVGVNVSNADLARKAKHNGPSGLARRAEAAAAATQRRADHEARLDAARRLLDDARDLADLAGYDRNAINAAASPGHLVIETEVLLSLLRSVVHA
jgi:hypothetical protein